MFPPLNLPPNYPIPDSAASVEVEEEEAKQEEQENPKKKKGNFGNKAVINGKLIHFLKLFSLLRNPKTIPSSKQLYAVFVRMLSRSDVEIQKLAIECLRYVFFHHTFF